MIWLLTITREKMETCDFGEVWGAFLFAVFPLSLSSPYHKPMLTNISNKVKVEEAFHGFISREKSFDCMAPKRKENPPNGDESPSEGEETPLVGKEISIWWDVQSKVQRDGSIKMVQKVYVRFSVYVWVKL